MYFFFEINDSFLKYAQNEYFTVFLSKVMIFQIHLFNLSSNRKQFLKKLSKAILSYALFPSKYAQNECSTAFHSELTVSRGFYNFVEFRRGMEKRDGKEKKRLRVVSRRGTKIILWKGKHDYIHAVFHPFVSTWIKFSSRNETNRRTQLTSFLFIL